VHTISALLFGEPHAALGAADQGVQRPIGILS